jgi:hypothetical protein
LVEVQKASVNEQFEEFLSESVTVSITGDDAEEVGKMMKLLTSNTEPKEVEEQLTFSNDGAKNLLTLGTDMNISEINNNGFTLSNNDLDDILGENLMRDSKGKIRVFMLRAGAAKEAHHNNGVVYPNKNTKQGGYVIKLNEEKNNVNNTILNESVQTVQNERTNTTTYSGKGGRLTLSAIRARENGKTGYIREQAELTSGQEYSKGYGIESAGQENAGSPAKNTISKIRAKQKEIKVKESIDKGIESGLSMAGAGESIGRDMGEKIRKKDGEISVAETIGDGGESATSISDKKEDDLKKVGINLSTFKARRPIG